MSENPVLNIYACNFSYIPKYYKACWPHETKERWPQILPWVSRLSMPDYCHFLCVFGVCILDHTAAQTKVHASETCNTTRGHDRTSIHKDNVQPEPWSQVSQDVDKIGRFRCMRCHWEDGVGHKALIDLCVGRWDLSLISKHPGWKWSATNARPVFRTIDVWGNIFSNCRKGDEPTMKQNPTLGSLCLIHWSKHSTPSDDLV